MSKIAVTNIGQLVTLTPLADEKRLTNISREDLGCIDSAWMTISAGKVEASGTGELPSQYKGIETYDAQQNLVTPGFIDCHTHPVFAGNRSQEFCQRLDGSTYQEIAEKGGGIKFTRRATLEASKERLIKLTESQIDKFLKCGTTAIEAKSGYGLTVDSEVKLLEVLAHIKQLSPIHLETTCLALHAVPDEFTSKQQFITEMTDKLLPIVAKRKLAKWVDAFLEKGYFSKVEVIPFLRKAKQLNLGIRLHIDEFTDQEGGTLAASHGAITADHCEHTSVEGILAMAKTGTISVLLPGTSLYTKIPFANAKLFTENNCPVALASDYNPGSCRFYNLGFIATLGALHNGLTMAEAFAAITYVAAAALDIHHKKGSLAPGFDADFLVLPYPNLSDWLADAGQQLPKEVFIEGKNIYLR